MSNKFRTIQFYENHIIKYFALVKNTYFEMLVYYNNIFIIIRMLLAPCTRDLEKFKIPLPKQSKL